MNYLILIAFIINIIIVIIESYTLINLKRKKDIFKYYTYLQNTIALIISILFIISFIINKLSNTLIPEYIKGLRYISTCSLIFTTIIYVLFLSQNKNNLISEDDFKSNLSPKKANLFLHYICPILSLVSFVVFEREISISTDYWTALVALPSCLYWIIYLILTVTKVWNPPYEFSSLNNKKTNKILDIFITILIPFIFILVSYIIWNIK